MKFLKRRDFLKEAAGLGLLAFSASVKFPSLVFDHMGTPELYWNVCSEFDQSALNKTNDIKVAFFVIESDNILKNAIVKLFLYQYREHNLLKNKTIVFVNPFSESAFNPNENYHVIFISGVFSDPIFQSAREKAKLCGPGMLISITGNVDTEKELISNHIWKRELVVNLSEKFYPENIVSTTDDLYRSIQMPGGSIAFDISDIQAEFMNNSYSVKSIEGNEKTETLCEKFLVENRQNFMGSEHIFIILSHKIQDYNLNEIAAIYEMINNSLSPAAKIGMIDTIGCHLEAAAKITALFSGRD